MASRTWEVGDADACWFGFRLQGVRLDPTVANRATSDRAIFRVLPAGSLRRVEPPQIFTQGKHEQLSLAEWHHAPSWGV